MAEQKAKGKKQAERQKGRGLDVGTAFIVCAEQKGDVVTLRSQRDGFFEVEYGEFAREMLTRAGVNYIQKGDSLYVVGDEALEFANVFNREMRRPLRSGVLSPTEREALPMVELVIQRVIGEPTQPGEIAYFSVPDRPVDAELDVVYHEKIVQEMLGKLGYEAKPINEGLAVVFSELADDNFTGIGLSFGSGLVNMCLSFMSVPVVSFSVTRAGDWIDHQVAMAMAETATRICAIKESTFDLTKTEGLSRIEKALSIYYDALIDYVMAHVKRELEASERTPQVQKPLTIIISGGSAMPQGFHPRFEERLRATSLPVPVGEVRLAAQPLYSVAKGALVAARADESKR